MHLYPVFLREGERAYGKQKHQINSWGGWKWVCSSDWWTEASKLHCFTAMMMRFYCCWQLTGIGASRSSDELFGSSVIFFFCQCVMWFGGNKKPQAAQGLWRHLWAIWYPWGVQRFLVTCTMIQYCMIKIRCRHVRTHTHLFLACLHQNVHHLFHHTFI